MKIIFYPSIVNKVKLFDNKYLQFVLGFTPWTQGVNWTYIRRSEDAQDVFWTSYVRSIYALCPGGK